MEMGSGRFLTTELTPLVKSVKLALRKFHVQTGFPSVSWTNVGVVTNDGVVISDRQCWNPENLSRTQCIESGSCLKALIRARYELVWVFQQPEMNE